MKEFKREQFVAAVGRIRALMAENRDYLIELDSKIGDGDLGLTMLRGFTAAKETAESLDESDVGMLFKRAGMALAKAAPSTMGTLMGTAFIGAGKEFAQYETLTAAVFRRLYTIMADAVGQRGKSKEGEKTLLDVLYPAGRAMEACESDDIAVCLKAASDEAILAAERTKDMINQHGKAAVFREKTRGLPDPGGEAARLMIQGFAETIEVGGKTNG